MPRSAFFLWVLFLTTFRFSGAVKDGRYFGISRFSLLCATKIVSTLEFEILRELQLERSKVFTFALEYSNRNIKNQSEYQQIQSIIGFHAAPGLRAAYSFVYGSHWLAVFRARINIFQTTLSIVTRNICKMLPTSKSILTFSQVRLVEATATTIPQIR